MIFILPSFSSDANVHYKYKGRGLADWCAKIRRNEDKLTPEQRSKLKCVGFDFANTQDRNWMANFERLKIYVQKHGSCRQVARDYNDGRGTDLCNWVSKQRSLHGML